MMQRRGWQVPLPGERVVFYDEHGNLVRGFVEMKDLGLGVAWIRDQTSGERRMITRDEYQSAEDD